MRAIAVEQHDTTGMDDSKQAARLRARITGGAHQGGFYAPDDAENPHAYDVVGTSVFLALCAEPGMGKTFLVTRLVQAARDQNCDVLTLAIDVDRPEAYSKRFVRACREIARKLPTCHNPLVIVDDVPGLDECDVQSEARALTKLYEHGCKIVLCMRPEAEQLLESLPYCQCLRCEDLLFRYGDSDSLSWRLTGGIPSLLMAYRADALAGVQTITGTKYGNELEHLVDATLRSGLPLEELRVRLAMIILGKGTLEEVQVVSGRCDAEQFAWLRRDVPLLGIDRQDNTFACHGVADDEVLLACLHALQAHAADEQELVVRACGVLASRGDIRRSAAVCSLLSSERAYATTGMMWGALYASVGEVSLVEEALHAARTLECAFGTCGLLSEAAVTMLVKPSSEVARARERIDALELTTLQEQTLYRQVGLLSACRDICRSPHHTMVGVGVPGNDAAGAMALTHVQVAKTLSTGGFAEAYAQLNNSAIVREDQSVFSALLCDDLYLALYLSGGVPDRREQQLFDAARRYFARPKMGHLQAYHVAIEHMPALLVGWSSETTLLEDAANAADRVGDRYLHALFLATMAVGDVRGGALSRAHVRAEKAATLARLIDEDYLASTAELIDAIALSLLGETGALGAWCAQRRRPDELALIGKLCAHAAGELAQGEAELHVPLALSFPHNAYWLVQFVARDCRNISEGLQALIPPTWRELLNAIELRQEPLFAQTSDGDLRRMPRESVPQQAPVGALRRGEQGQLLVLNRHKERIRISIFGGFGVEVDGTVITDNILDRRRARDLVMLLAVVPTHRLRRYQITEILWPDSDYVRGPRKLYEATGEARKRLGELLDGLNPIIADRTQGAIGYDATLVGCDVDDFEREAHLTLAEDGDDFGILDHARRMERLYGSGPDPHLATLGGKVVERLTELQTMYIDAAVAAGEAALRLGKTKLAVHFAANAHRMGELREDAMILFVHALRAAGRGFEVLGYYRQFSRRLIEAEGVPPSLSLRRAVALASDKGLETLSA